MKFHNIISNSHDLRVFRFSSLSLNSQFLSTSGGIIVVSKLINTTTAKEHASIISRPPTKGKANQELLRFMSDILGVRRVYLTIEKGIIGKKKTIAIKGLLQHQVTIKLEEHQTTAKVSRSSLL